MRFLAFRSRKRSALTLIHRVVSAGLLVCLTLGAQAQSRFCLGGELDQLSTAQRTACSAKLASVRDAARRFGAPEGWHFVLVCGEEGWKSYAAFSSRTAAELENASADTDSAAHSTYLREEKLGAARSPESTLRLDRALPDRPLLNRALLDRVLLDRVLLDRVLLDRAVAHEIAAVVLQTADEAAIQAKVNLWMGRDGAEPAHSAPVLTASR